VAGPSLEEQLHALFAEPIDDVALRTRIEALAGDYRFNSLTPVWGPPLYRRNRVMFRPFILAHFSRWSAGFPLRWKGKYQEALEQWLAEADRLDDVELCRQLYAWKMSSFWRRRRRWQEDLLRRFAAAGALHERNHVLAKYDLGEGIDDETARRLYETDPTAARPFLLGRLPADRGAWLQDLARRCGDDPLHFAFYRRRVGLAEWERDVLRLCDEVHEPARLVAELEKRHPEQPDYNLGNSFYQLARRRGRDVFPYLLPHLGQVWRPWMRSWFGNFLALTLEQRWLDLWAALIRTCGDWGEFDRTVAALLADTTLPESDVVERLCLLAGVSHEWNLPGLGIAQVRPLSDPTAATLYARFPDLVRGPFKMHVASAWSAEHPRLLHAVLDADDEDLIDHLASRALTQLWLHKRDLAGLERLAGHYQQLLGADPAAFARRAVNVLGQVPAFAIGNWSYNRLIRTNRLARLLLERSAGLHLHQPGLLRDLLEAPSIHAQVLALRALALDDDLARAAAADNLDLLLPTLLRPLHRGTRLLAFRALANAAATEGHARTVLGRAREALDLPDKRYPKEGLIGLLGRLLHAWPGLRGAGEGPAVHTWSRSWSRSQPPTPQPAPSAPTASGPSSGCPPTAADPSASTPA
jgi:hypothetical protein